MKRRTAISTIAGAATLAALSGESAMADDNKTIAIIGTGRMGAAFGKTFSGGGYKIIYGSRNPSDEKVQSVVKATPGASAI